MQWGYHGRSLEGAEAFWRYMTRRLSRFYPDFLISSVLAYVFSLPFVFGCTFKLASLWWNALALSLLHVWVRVWTPEMMPANGPAWFIVTLVWLWIAFPFIRDPAVSFFSGDRATFWAKLGAFWLATCAMWAVLNGTLFFDPTEPIDGSNNVPPLHILSTAMIPASSAVPSAMSHDVSTELWAINLRI